MSENRWANFELDELEAIAEALEEAGYADGDLLREVEDELKARR